MQRAAVVAAFAFFAVACSNGAPATPDVDAAQDSAPAEVAADAETYADADGAADAMDAPDGGCFVKTWGVWGECITTTACSALGRHVSTPGYCPGSSDIECCTAAPDTADNPPVPSGWKLMQQSAVTSDMTAWAVAILHDPVTYPMYSSTTKTFGSLLVMARVEWHPPDFNNSAIHRGVTLYQPG